MTDLDPRWPRLLTAARLARANAIPRTSSLTKGPFDRLMEATAAFDASDLDQMTPEQAEDLADRSPQLHIASPTLVASPGSPTGYVLVVPAGRPARGARSSSSMRADLPY